MAKPVLNGTAITLKSKKVGDKTKFGLVGEKMGKKPKGVVIKQKGGDGKWEGAVQGNPKKKLHKIEVTMKVKPTDGKDAPGDLGEISITVTNDDNDSATEDFPAVFESP